MNNLPTSERQIIENQFRMRPSQLLKQIHLKWTPFQLLSATKTDFLKILNNFFATWQICNWSFECGMQFHRRTDQNNPSPTSFAETSFDWCLYKNVHQKFNNAQKFLPFLHVLSCKQSHWRQNSQQNGFFLAGSKNFHKFLFVPCKVLLHGFDCIQWMAKSATIAMTCQWLCQNS